jgi:aminoglycoside phosphotransferase (APT) family kinase protein
VQTAGVDERVGGPEPEVVGALRAWLVERHGGPVELAEPVEHRGEGFDSTVSFVRLRGPALPVEWTEPLVLRVKADAGREDEARAEAAVQEWLAGRGYPAPRVLHVWGPGELVGLPVQAMERAPGELVLDRVRAAPWRAPREVTALARAHVALHQLPVEGFPSDEHVLDARLGLTRRMVASGGLPQLAGPLERVEALAGRLRAAPESICHGDFHPLNVLSDGGRLTVVDWTDAGVGDRHADVARTLALFDLARIAAGGRVERAALTVAGPLLGRLYRRGYQRRLPIDPARIELWLPVQVLHGWAQALALHAGLFDRDDPSDDRAERVPPSLVDELQRRFEAAIARVS